MTKGKEWQRLFLPVAGIGLLFAVLALCAYFFGGVFWYITLGMLILVAVTLLVWLLLSPNRTLSYVLGTIQLENTSPKKLQRMQKAMSSTAMADGGLKRIMNWEPEKISGTVRLQGSPEGTAVYQMWADNRLYFFIFRRNNGKRGKMRWILDGMRGGRFGGDTPENALPAESVYRHGKAINLGIAAVAALAAYGLIFLLFGVGDQNISRLKGIATNSAKSLQTGQAMVMKENLPEEFDRYQQAVAEITQELLAIKDTFDEQMTAIEYSKQLEPETLVADRENGLNDVMTTLQQGYAYAETYFENLAATGNQDHVEQVFDAHQVPENLQTLYFEKIDHFHVKNVDGYVKAYDNAVRLGTFLQNHLDQWEVGEDGQVKFSDETVMDEYNQLYAEIQKHVQELS